MSNDINSGTALITGANKGIGKEIARQLLAAGLTVYVGSRDAERGLRAVEELGAGARPLAIDVTDGKSVAAAAEQVEHLDILVNNAGISAQGTDVTEADVDEFRQVYETNVFGVVAVTNAFLPLLRRSPTPRIVNISSETGSIALSASRDSTAFAAYRSSKTALNELTILYSLALAEKGFKVNAVAPGLRRTELNELAKSAGGDPAEAAAGAVRLALLPDDGPTGAFFLWDGSKLDW